MKTVEHSKFNARTKLLSISLFVFFLIFGTQNFIAQTKIYTVVLDAGHGGSDPGNLGNGFKEKDIALKITKEVGALLSRNKDIRVVYTRKKDVFVDLWKRGDIANDVKADVFVSFHCDSHTSNANGIGTFVLGLRGNKMNLEIAKRENSVILLEKDYEKNYDYNPDSPESIIGLSLLQEENLDQSLQLASLIQNQIVSKLERHNRHVKMGNFQVLRETVMPSVLVELGFLTNRKEGRYLNSKKGQKAMAKNIAKSIRKYIEQLKLNTVVVDNERVVVKSTSSVKKITKKKGKIEFKVQIASSKRKIATKSYNFKGLRKVERVKVNSYYKYYYGKTTSYKRVKTLLSKAKKKGFSTALIAAFKNGKKISVKEALKTK